MHLKNITIDQSRFPTTEAYPFNLPLMQESKGIKPGWITIFTGENGTGKSTLLKAICQRCHIHIWEGMGRSRYEINPHEDSLHHALDIEWADGPVPGSFFSPELFRNYTQLVDEWAVNSPGILKHYGGSSLVTKSHGQSCMSYFQSIYKVKGLYFLDEPEAALSPKSQLALLALLQEMVNQGHAQFFISTHSPLLMSSEKAVLYSFNGDSIKNVHLEETDHFQVYKSFFQRFC